MRALIRRLSKTVLYALMAVVAPICLAQGRPERCQHPRHPDPLERRRPVGRDSGAVVWREPGQPGDRLPEHRKLPDE